MSTPNAKTRQLSLPKILKDGISRASAPSSDSETGDQTELNKSVKVGRNVQKKNIS